jgi:hypothetical protein
MLNAKADDIDSYIDVTKILMLFIYILLSQNLIIKFATIDPYVLFPGHWWLTLQQSKDFFFQESRNSISVHSLVPSYILTATT